jgi:hypothetical protein
MLSPIDFAGCISCIAFGDLADTMPDKLILGQVCPSSLQCSFIFDSLHLQTYVITGALVEAPYTKSGQQPPTGKQLRLTVTTDFLLDPEASAVFSVKTFQDLEVW